MKKILQTLNTKTTRSIILGLIVSFGIMAATSAVQALSVIPFIGNTSETINRSGSLTVGDVTSASWILQSINPNLSAAGTPDCVLSGNLGSETCLDVSGGAAFVNLLIDRSAFLVGKTVIGATLGNGTTTSFPGSDTSRFIVQDTGLFDSILISGLGYTNSSNVFSPRDLTTQQAVCAASDGTLKRCVGEVLDTPVTYDWIQGGWGPCSDPTAASCNGSWTSTVTSGGACEGSYTTSTGSGGVCEGSYTYTTSGTSSEIDWNGNPFNWQGGILYNDAREAIYDCGVSQIPNGVDLFHTTGAPYQDDIGENDNYYCQYIGNGSILNQNGTYSCVQQGSTSDWLISGGGPNNNGLSGQSQSIKNQLCNYGYTTAFRFWSPGNSGNWSQYVTAAGSGFAPGYVVTVNGYQGALTGNSGSTTQTYDCSNSTSYGQNYCETYPNNNTTCTWNAGSTTISCAGPTTASACTGQNSACTFNTNATSVNNSCAGPTTASACTGQNSACTFSPAGESIKEQTVTCVDSEGNTHPDQVCINNGSGPKPPTTSTEGCFAAPTCGTANGTTGPEPSGASLCGVGTASTVNATGSNPTNYTWNCTSGIQSISCSSQSSVDTNTYSWDIGDWGACSGGTSSSGSCSGTYSTGGNQCVFDIQSQSCDGDGDGNCNSFNNINTVTVNSLAECLSYIETGCDGRQNQSSSNNGTTASCEWNDYGPSGGTEEYWDYTGYYPTNSNGFGCYGNGVVYPTVNNPSQRCYEQTTSSGCSQVNTNANFGSCVWENRSTTNQCSGPTTASTCTAQDSQCIWNSGSTSGQTQSRSVVCRDQNGQLAADSNCPPPKPDTVQSCGGDLGSGDLVNGNPSCFIAGTQVELANGSMKNIQDVELGDILRGEISDNRVIGFHQPLLGDKKLYSFNAGKYFVTAEHPFMTLDGWKALDPKLAVIEHNLDIEVGQLATGDILITDKGQELLETIDAKSDHPDTQLYNFILDGDKTYYADGYLVHNKVDNGGQCSTSQACAFGTCINGICQ